MRNREASQSRRGTISRERRASAIFPLGRTLFRDGAQAFARILESGQLIEKHSHRLAHAVAQRKSHRTENRFFGHGEHGAGVRGDLLGHFFYRFVELVFFHHAIYEAETERAFGADDFSGEHQFESAFGSDDERQNGRAERRKDAELYFRLREFRARSGDHQIAERGEFRAAAKRGTIHDYKEGLRSIEHGGEGALKCVEDLKRAAWGVFAELDSSAEGLARGIEDDQLYVAAALEGINAHGEFREHAFVEHVVLGALEREARDFAIDAEANVLEFFGLGRRGADVSGDGNARSFGRRRRLHGILRLQRMSEK